MKSNFSAIGVVGASLLALCPSLGRADNQVPSVPLEVTKEAAAYSYSTNPNYLDRNQQPLAFGLGFYERFLELNKESKFPIQVSLLNEANKALNEEVYRGVYRSSAKAGWGYLLDVNTGEILALSAVENEKKSDHWLAHNDGHSARLTLGIYEHPSVSRLITTALGLEKGLVELDTKINTKEELKYRQYSIRDSQPQARQLSVEEVFLHRSSVGSARIAQKLGITDHKEFFEKLGQLKRLETPLLMDADPILPKNWNRLATLTIAFGHGIAATPLQAGMAVSTLVNGGYLVRPTLQKQDTKLSEATRTQVVSNKTSAQLRYLLRRDVEIGASKVLDVANYPIGGMGAISPKVLKGKYTYEKVQTSMISVFPISEPKYLLMILLDEPESPAETNKHNATASNTGEISTRVISRLREPKT